MAALLARAVNPPAATQDFFIDDEDSIFENDTNNARRIWDHSGM